MSDVDAGSRSGGGDVRRRLGGRSAVVTQKVRTATLELLDEVGYERLQLPAVAARAGVNKTTVYRRWPTKVLLVAELLQELTAEQVPVPDTGSLQGDLEAMLGQVAGVLRLPAVRAIIRAVITLADDDPEFDTARRRFWDLRFGQATVIVQRAVEREELPADTHPRTFLEQVFGVLYLRSLIIGSEVGPRELRELAAYCARTPATVGPASPKSRERIRSS